MESKEKNYAINLLHSHDKNRLNFLNFILTLRRSDSVVGKKLLIPYYVLNFKIMLLLIILKFLDILTTQVGLSTGLAQESNAFIIPFLNEIIVLYIVSFVPMVLLIFINFYVMKAKRLGLLKLLTVSSCLLMLLLAVTVANNFIVLYQALI
ncbi:MAG: DUF5658 family protein [Promethearchaeota archaeon]